MRALILIAALFLIGADRPLPQIPNPKLTPGAMDRTVVISRLSLKKLCSTGYTDTVRNVSDATRKKVFASYGIDPTKYPKGSFEVDHLCSLELGCNNDIKNLWPESYVTRPYNAHHKDVLENKLHDMVCKGQMPLKDAQQAISKDWIAAYKKYVSPRSGPN